MLPAAISSGQRKDVAGIGPITVDPALQNGTIGRRLMEAVLERARQGVQGVRLVQAAYHSRSLSLYTEARLRRPRAARGPAGRRRVDSGADGSCAPRSKRICNRQAIAAGYTATIAPRSFVMRSATHGYRRGA